MLFDLYGEILFKGTLPPGQSGSHFDTIPLYQKLNYEEQRYQSSVSCFTVLTKHTDSDAIFRNEAIQVFIYGYCFSRILGGMGTPKRLTAADIAAFYLQEGTGFVEQVKGSFSLIIIDISRQNLHIVTDPLNVRPLYYFDWNSRYYISTSLQVLIRQRQQQGIPTELNYQSVLHYHLFDYILDDETYIKDISCTPPGTCLTLNQSGIHMRQYWNVFNRFPEFEATYTYDQSVQKLEWILKQNLDLYLPKSGKTAVALTGGYDSRTNLALLGEQARNFLFYSYGIRGTYDLSIPRQIASSMDLEFKSIYLEEEYAESFVECADFAVSYGDGIGEANRANYVFAYRQLGNQYNSILTGLFGSELIKPPTSVGSFIDHNIKMMLASDTPEQSLEAIYEQTRSNQLVSDEIFSSHKAAVYHSVLTNPYLTNRYAMPQKYFYFLLMVGIRKYFMKEITLERPFVENLHPFFDIEFIETLLQTPFPWVYNWSTEKDLMKSLKTHKFYVSLIHKNNPKLSKIISTHAYTPKFLLNLFYIPVLVMQYAFLKNKIRNKGSFQSQENIWAYYQFIKPQLERTSGFCNNQLLEENRFVQPKEFAKLISLQSWLNKNNLQT